MKITATWRSCKDSRTSRDPMVVLVDPEQNGEDLLDVLAALFTTGL